MLELKQMKWKKILFLCLTVVFVFGFYNDVFAAEPIPGLIKKEDTGSLTIYTIKNDPTQRTILVNEDQSNRVTLQSQYYSREDESWFNGRSTSLLRRGEVNGRTYYENPADTGSANGSQRPLYTINQSDGALLQSIMRVNVGTTPYNTITQQINALSQGGATTDPNTGAVVPQPINPNAPEANPVPPPDPDKPKYIKGVTCSSLSEIFNPLCLIASLTYNVVLTMASWFAGASGLVFNMIMQFTVLQMADNIKGGFIEQGWKILRDIVNIMFIFVLLFTGIMTIIQGFSSGTSKKIATVIVVALLINFSLFFTKIIIDSSNIIAVQFYESIKGQSAPGDSSGIAGQFIVATKIGSLYSPGGGPPSGVIDQVGGADKYLQIILTSIGGSIILVVLGIIIFIASLMLITRFIVLIFVMIASSAAIGSWIVPKLKSQIWDKWWNALIGQAFFAPIFLLFLLLTLMLVTQLKPAPNITWAALFTGNPSAGIGLIMNYLIIVGSLVGTLIISKSLSNMAGGSAGKITSFMGGAVMGTTAFAGRNFVGRTAGNLAKKMDPTGAGSLFLKSRLEGLSKKTYDPRNAGFGVSKIIGDDLGKGTKQSFALNQAKRDEAAAKRAKSISDDVNPNDTGGPGGKPRTYREIYETSRVRVLTGGGGHRANVLKNKAKKDELKAKQQLQKGELDSLEREVKNYKTSQGYEGFQRASETQQQEINVLQTALGAAIAAGNAAREASIRGRLSTAQKSLVTTKVNISRIDDAIPNLTVSGGKTYKERKDELEEQIKETGGAAKKVGETKDASTKDLLKAIEKMNKESK